MTKQRWTETGFVYIPKSAPGLVEHLHEMTIVLIYRVALQPPDR
jgi:hypothetical protein